MKAWDYDISKNWRPATDLEWQWFLVRKINYDDFEGLKKEIVKRHFKRIKKWLDSGKRAMLEDFIKNETH